MSERNGSGTESNHGSNVDTSVAKGNGEEGLHIIQTELGSFSDPKSPKWGKVEDTSGHLDSSNSPWESEHIQSLLVVDIIGNVEEVPKCEVRSDLERFPKTSLGLFSLGTSSGRKSQRSRRLKRVSPVR